MAQWYSASFGTFVVYDVKDLYRIKFNGSMVQCPIWHFCRLRPEGFISHEVQWLNGTVLHLALLSFKTRRIYIA